MNTLIQNLQSTWHQEIPISAAMGIEIVEFTGDEFAVQAALTPNVNVHGTGFAGSLYAICALTGWGMIWLQLQSAGIDGSIVMSEGHIEYIKPVREKIVCRCHFDANAQRDNLSRLAKFGSCEIQAASIITARGEEAVEFDGVYSVRLRQG